MKAARENRMSCTLPILRIFILSTLIRMSDGEGSVIFCPLLEIAPQVHGREDTALDLYTAWNLQGSQGQLFHTGCLATLPSDPGFTCQDPVNEFLLTTSILPAFKPSNFVAAVIELAFFFLFQIGMHTASYELDRGR